MGLRIRVMGGSGSGKSTFSKGLGNELDIFTVFNLDDIFWQQG